MAFWSQRIEHSDRWAPSIEDEKHDLLLMINVFQRRQQNYRLHRVKTNILSMSGRFSLKSHEENELTCWITADSDARVFDAECIGILFFKKVFRHCSAIVDTSWKWMFRSQSITKLEANFQRFSIAENSLDWDNNTVSQLSQTSGQFIMSIWKTDMRCVTNIFDKHYRKNRDNKHHHESKSLLVEVHWDRGMDSKNEQECYRSESPLSTTIRSNMNSSLICIWPEYLLVASFSAWNYEENHRVDVEIPVRKHIQENCW